MVIRLGSAPLAVIVALSLAAPDALAQELASLAAGKVDPVIDGEVWKDDAVELFLQRRASGPVYHLVVNAAGDCLDERDRDPAWDCGCDVAVGRGPGGWQVELLVPWAAVGGPPADGEQRRVASRRADVRAGSNLHRRAAGGFQAVGWLPRGDAGGSPYHPRVRPTDHTVRVRRGHDPHQRYCSQDPAGSGA